MRQTCRSEGSGDLPYERPIVLLFGKAVKEVRHLSTGMTLSSGRALQQRSDGTKEGRRAKKGQIDARW